MILGFFEALFGSAYIGGRLLGSKLDDIASQNREKTFKEIWASVTDLGRELTMEKELVLKMPTIKLSDEIPREDLVFVFGRDYASLLSQYQGYLRRDKYPGDGFYDLNSILFNIILSQHGLIRYDRMISGYNWRTPVNGVPFDRRDGICQRACNVIDRNIRTAHPSLDLFLCEVDFKETSYLWSAHLRNCNIPTRHAF